MLNRSVKLILFFSLFVFNCIFAACEPDNRNPNGTHPRFTSYDQASSWYQRSGKLEWMRPDSTAIAKAAYHKDDKVMLIFFTSNPSKGYIFGGVPASVWNSFKAAPSKGKYYNQNINGRYHYKLRED